MGKVRDKPKTTKAAKPPGKRGPKRGAPNAGRPKGTYKVTINDDMLRKVENMASLGLTTKEIAVILDVSERTVTRYAEQEENFLSSIEKGAAKGVMHSAEKLRGHIEEGSLDATKFYLRCRGKWREADKEPPQQAQTAGTTVVVINANGEKVSGDVADVEVLRGELERIEQQRRLVDAQGEGE